VDTLGDARFGCIFSRYLNLCGDQLARAVRDMIARAGSEHIGDATPQLDEEFVRSDLEIGGSMRMPKQQSPGAMDLGFNDACFP
jgi:hypothetical protein